jgi:hypothetical protein
MSVNLLSSILTVFSNFMKARQIRPIALSSDDTCTAS